MEALTIRPSRDADVPAITAIYAHHVETGTASFETVAPAEAEMRTRRNVPVEKRYPRFVAERGGCRYIARPAVSNERLSVNDLGQVVYRLKHSFHDGTTQVWTLSPASPPARASPPLRLTSCPPAHRLPDTLPSLPAPPHGVTSTAKRLRSHRQRT